MIKWMGRLLCSLGSHRILHVGTFLVGRGSIEMGYHMECSRCGCVLDYHGNCLEKQENTASSRS